MYRLASEPRAWLLFVVIVGGLKPTPPRRIGPMQAIKQGEQAVVAVEILMVVVMKIGLLVPWEMELKWG